MSISFHSFFMCTIIFSMMFLVIYGVYSGVGNIKYEITFLDGTKAILEAPGCYSEYGTLHCGNMRFKEYKMIRRLN